jgi:predicted class III extradiol MEMO1 family dioxygenase
MGQLLRARVEKGEKILILSGVDLAHVGPRFGDEEKLTPELRERIKKEDEQTLKLAFQMDHDPFFMSGIGTNSWRKICGLSALYTALRLIAGMSPTKTPAGRLLSYGQADDPLGGVVSFASALIE